MLQNDYEITSTSKFWNQSVQFWYLHLLVLSNSLGLISLSPWENLYFFDFRIIFEKLHEQIRMLHVLVPKLAFWGDFITVRYHFCARKLMRTLKPSKSVVWMPKMTFSLVKMHLQRCVFPEGFPPGAAATHRRVFCLDFCGMSRPFGNV